MPYLAKCGCNLPDYCNPSDFFMEHLVEEGSDENNQ